MSWIPSRRIAAKSTKPRLETEASRSSKRVRISCWGREELQKTTPRSRLSTEALRGFRNLAPAPMPTGTCLLLRWLILEHGPSNQP